LDEAPLVRLVFGRHLIIVPNSCRRQGKITPNFPYESGLTGHILGPVTRSVARSWFHHGRI
jgi:hypothetical protein